MNRAWYITAFIVVLLLCTGIWLKREVDLSGKQINDLILCRRYGSFAEDYYKAHRSFPLRLADAIPSTEKNKTLKNAWGFPVHYESDGKYYILVSYGRDGKPDGLDCAKLRITPGFTKICGEWDSDQVFSDLGQHRICGK